MSTVKINGRDVDFKNLNAEGVSFTTNIAKLAHLDDPLPTGEDIGEEEFLELQSQLCHMHELPSKARSVMLAALCAGHSYRIAEALRKTSPDGQANMYASYIQILSLFPEAGQEPYFRMFLRSPEAKGLANLVAQSFIDGIKCFNPSGPGRICHLIIECLLWGETSDGDDRQACMDVKVRNDLEVRLAVFKGTDEWPRLRGFDQMCVDRLDGLLLIIRTVPGPDGHYLQSSKGYLIGGSGDDCCAGGDLDCNEAPSMRCARCKSVEYCGKKCQTKHWKAGHKLRCFSRVQ